MDDVTIQVLVWEDLPAGKRAAQACHAIAQLCAKYRHRAELYALATIVVLIANAAEIRSIATQADYYGLAYGLWAEPDYGDALTAVAIEDGNKLTRDFALA